MAQLYLGVDLGGTKIAAGIVDALGNILCKKTIRTDLPKPKEELEKNIYQLCHTLCCENGYHLDKDILAVGIGCPGSVDSKHGFVAANVNFGYENWALKQNLQTLFHLPVFIENDANAALLAEVVAGAAKNCKNAVIITLGTGIGGGVLIDGTLFSGHNLLGTEVGHTVIEFNGRQCNCGRKGCFERYASASALTADTKKAMAEYPQSLLWQVCPDLEKVNAKVAFDAAGQQDAIALALVKNYIEYLACGITNIINLFQPEILCIGGGVSNEQENLLIPLRKIIEREDFARNTQQRTKLVIAKFRNDAGIIGAALLGVNNA